MEGPLRALLAALVLLVLPVSANAQNVDDSKRGIYFELRGGLNYLTDSNIDIAGVSGADIEAQFDHGYVVEGAIGYEHSSGFRGEIAVGYRSNDIDDATVNGVSVATFCTSLGVGCSGDVQTYSFMANGYYAFNVGGGFKPFIGAGIGAAVVDGEVQVSVPGIGSASVSDDDTVFAYQGIAGVEYQFPTDLGPIALGMRYTYFATTDPEFGGVVSGEYSSHSVLAGVRIIR